MNDRRHDHDLAAIVIIVAVVITASLRPLPGLRDVVEMLPDLINLVATLRK